MSDTPKIRARIISSFTDHGTGQSFTAGSTEPIDAGSFANYKAARLVEAAPAKAKAAKAKAPAKPKARSGANKPAASTTAMPTPPATRREVG